MNEMGLVHKDRADLVQQTCQEIKVDYKLNPKQNPTLNWTRRYPMVYDEKLAIVYCSILKVLKSFAEIFML